MQGRKLKKIGIATIIAGISICLFPSIANEFNEKKIEYKIYKYIEEAHSDNLDNLYKEFENYNQELVANGQKLVDAFSYQDTKIDLSKYGYRENIVGYIYVPKMDIKLPIYLGATKQNLKKGAALLSQTSMPIGGNNTNSVIAAHRNMTTSKMFRNIQMLKVGDEIIVTNTWEELKYVVVHTKVISPYNIDSILIQEEKELITLITCHPLGSNKQRYLVYAERQK